MTKQDRDLYRYIEEYLDTQKREYITDDFAYATYTSPNTMFNFGNTLPEIMESMSVASLRVFIRCLKISKRNHDPVMACSIDVSYQAFQDICAKATYYRCLAELRELKVLIKTPKKSCYIIAVNHANKLFKPTIEI